MRLCSGPGCGCKVPDNVRFCDECKPARTEDDIRKHSCADRDEYASLYTGPRWKEHIQPMVLQRHPFCARCGTALSVIADHIVPAGEAIRQVHESGRFLSSVAGFFILSNLQGLCRACHALKTIEDKEHVGPWDSVLEAEDRAKGKHIV